MLHAYIFIIVISSSSWMDPLNIMQCPSLSRVTFFILKSILSDMSIATLAFFFFYLFIYLFIYFWLCWVFVSLRGLSLIASSGGTLHRGARASHCRGLSCCRAQAPDTQAQQLWLTGLAAPRHVGSSQTRARTRVPCIARQILNHCATREAPNFF